ncbi:MAG TPA: pyruvate kinase [Candidatus Fimenecus stercoravium]|nr:pyruvate kinase [Candidatus Fimenecus stercoravium]
MRKTKIICTVGPATDKPGVLESMMRAGMNVARFNFSHGDYAVHQRRFEQLVELREKAGLPVASMLDTRGPEIRLGTFRDHKPVEIHTGEEYTLTTRDVECDEKIASVTFKGLPGDVRVGTRILINDGLVSMVVKKVTETDVICDVIDGGMLSDHKGVNVPGVELSMPYLSETDMNDLEFGAKLGFDFIAASFVRSAADVAYLRKFTNALGWRSVRIIAKIENMDGVNNIDEIIDEADGIMVARGDMGVEIPFEKIPPIQKRLIKKAYSAGKQVVTATQMLESMITNPRPTRAEITDVANAVYDGTSAIMLSGETAAGAHPVEAVETMALIAESTESQIDYVTHFKAFGNDSNTTITNAISHATVTTAHDLGAKAIITVTKSGSTARMISKHRPQSMIIGCTTNDTVCRQMSMSWGVVPLMCDEKRNTDELFSHAVDVARKNGLVEKGDTVVITAGIPLGISGTTNMLKVETL